MEGAECPVDAVRADRMTHCHPGLPAACHLLPPYLLNGPPKTSEVNNAIYQYRFKGTDWEKTRGLCGIFCKLPIFMCSSCHYCPRNMNRISKLLFGSTDS